MKNEEKIEITGDESKLLNSLRSSDAATRTFGASVKNVFSGVGRTVEAANKTFGTFGKVTAALGSGIVLKKLFSLDEFEKVDDALLMMQANLHMNARELDTFKTKMASMAGSAGEDMGELFKASSKLSKSYKPDDILKIMSASAMAADAMEQDLTGVQERIVQIMKMYHKTPDEAKSIAEALVATNSDSGTLDTLLQRGILKGGAGKDYKEVLAMASALKKAGADSPRVVMAVENILNAVQEKESVLKNELGVKLFRIDPATGKKVNKSIDQILTEMKPGMEKIRKKLGNEKFNEVTDKIFGQGASDAFPFLFGHIETIKKAREELGNAAQIAAERSAKADEKWSEQLNKIKGNLAGIKTDMSFIYDLGKKPVKFLADSPNLTKALGYGAAGLSAAVLGSMAFGKGKEFLKNLGGTAGGVAEGMALEAVSGVKPVFVTNWPGGVGGGPRAVDPLRSGPVSVFGRDYSAIGGKLGTALTFFAKASLVAGVGIAAYDMAAAIESEFIDGYFGKKAYDVFHKEEIKRGETQSRVLAAVQEANKKGDSVGAKTLLNPMNLAFHEGSKPITNQVKINLRIDENKRIMTESNDMNTLVKFGVTRASFVR